MAEGPLRSRGAALPDGLVLAGVADLALPLEDFPRLDDVGVRGCEEAEARVVEPEVARGKPPNEEPT